MDHALIERDALLERYVQGHLPPAVEEELEEHVVGCPSCQDDLVAIRGLARGVRRVASEEAARLAVRVTLAARLRRAFSGAGPTGGWGRSGRLAWLATGALVILVGLVVGYAAWLTAENSTLRATLAERAGAPSGAPASVDAREMGEAGEDARAADVRETDRVAALERTLPAAVGTVVLLTEVRGADAQGGETAPTVDPASLDGPYALAVYILDDPRFTSYRMQVVGAGGDADGKVLWQRSGLVPNAFEALMATFPPSFFPPGTYRVRVFGLTPKGDAVPLESYPFDVA